MSKAAKGLLIAAFCVLALWVGLSTLYTYSVSEELTTLRREGRSDIVYLRCRIRDLESELTARPTESTPATDESRHTESAGGEINDTKTDTTEAVSPDTAHPETESEPATEAVTIPTHNSPETIPSVDIEPETLPVSPYLVAAHEGIIGLFDASGALLRTVNVYIMTLPEADRAALTVGIPAGDWEEAMSLLEMYE